MSTVASAVVATFDSHPEVKSVSEAKATFLVDGDIVLVDFERVDETTWRASFEVQACSKTPTKIVRNSVFILSGVFHAVRKFLEVRQLERLTCASEALGTLYEAYLSRGKRLND
jgi:hypothetical protein